jgi:CHAT domain-containing protein
MRKLMLATIAATVLVLFAASAGAQTAAPDPLEQELWRQFQLDLLRVQQNPDNEQKREAAIDALSIEPKLTAWPASAGSRAQARALLQLIVAIANANRTKGDRARDLETAIACAQASLDVFARDAFPQPWGIAKQVLATAYARRVAGDRSANIEASLAAANEALGVFTAERDPTNWATTQTLLGIDYLGRVAGNRAQNIENAIQANEAAQTVFTREAHPAEWARNEGNLAIDYINRILGNRRDNIEAALKANLGVMDVYKNSPKAEDRITAASNLGPIYRKRIVGDHAQNVELGIKAEQEVLAAGTRDSDPDSWSTAQGALGNLYQERLLGSRAENLELSIKAFESALQVVTKETAPLEWALLTNNLGWTYALRIRGAAGDNKEKALSLIFDALTVRTRKAAPRDWAESQQALGKVYFNYLDGNYVSHLESGIAAYEAALSVYTREDDPQAWADCQFYLGTLYSERYLGNKAENVEKAIDHFRSALLVQTKAALPSDWAVTQHNLGMTYAERETGDKAENLRTAAGLLQDSASVQTREADPRNFLRTMSQLGGIEIKLGDWPAASKALLAGRGALLDLLAQNLDGEDERASVGLAGSLFTDLAFVSLRDGAIEQALAYLGEGRGILMSASLRRNGVALAPEAQQRADSVRADIRYWSGRTALPGEAGAEAMQYLQSLQQELASLYDSRATKERPSAMTQARAFLPEGGALVAPVATEVGGKLIVLVKQGGALRASVVDLPEFTTERVGRLERGDPYPAPLGGWRGALQAGRDAAAETDPERQRKLWSGWLDAIAAVGPQLWDAFLGAAERELAQAGVRPGARVFVVPTGPLGLFPLALAEDGATHARLWDAYEIAEAPSFEALADAAGRGEPARASLAAIVNPTLDLRYSELEGALVASRFDADAVSAPAPSQATLTNVLSALRGRDYWHFSTHGYFDWSNPLDSGLRLKDGTALTVAGLQDQHGELSHPRLVVLSACETGVYDTKQNVDEFVGLPAAFVALGASGVIATLWPVDDLATSLLMARFYELHRDGGAPPPTALKRAQDWLRDATGAELIAYARQETARARIGDQLPAIVRNITAAAAAASDRRPARGASAAAADSLAEKPYAHPYYWGGFIYLGL